jgi:hypothetical protein
MRDAELTHGSIGPVTKLLVAVTTAHSAPRSRCSRTSARALWLTIGRICAGHELAPPGVEQSTRVARQRLQLKVEKDIDIECARLVLLVEFDVPGFVKRAIENPLVDQELRPFEVAVSG